MCATSVNGVRSSCTGGFRRKLRCAAVAVLLWSATGAVVNADVITVFDNYKPNFGTATFSGQVINPLSPQRDRDYANAFVPSASGVVSDIWATVTMVSGVNEVDLWLMTDAGGAPDRVLEAWNVTNAMGLRGGLNPPVHVQGDGSTFIEAEQQYWLVASAPLPTVAQWMYNGVNDNGPTMARENMGAWTAGKSSLRGAFRVDVVPEPATLCIMAVGAVTLLRRRRSQHAR